MQKTIKHMMVTYNTIQLEPKEASKLRGFFAGQKRDNILLHQHIGDEVLYRYPTVQYKIISGHPTIIAIGDGIEAIYPLILSTKQIRIGDMMYPCGEFSMKISEQVVGDSNTMQDYRFLTPWFALNQQNYKRYERSTEEEKQELLAAVLRGNLLSLAKGLNVVVEGRLETRLRIEEAKIHFKNETMLAFLGGFSTNYSLPALLGIGKSVSRGYGAISKVF